MNYNQIDQIKKNIYNLARENEINYHKLIEYLTNIQLISIEYINFIRGLAIEIENINPIASYILMNKAYELRPNGTYIINRLINYNDKLGIGEGVIHKRANLYARHKNKLLEIAIAKFNQDLPFLSAKKFSDKDEDKATILSSIAENVIDSKGNAVSHFMGIMAYACSLASDERFSKIKVVFTREWNAASKSSLTSESNIQNKIDQVINKLELPHFISSKLQFQVLRSSEELPKAIIGTIIKMKSVAERHGTYIYEKNIYENFPVVTGQYNTSFDVNEFTDVFLVRKLEQVEGNKLLYVVPSFFKFKSNKHESLKIITAYSADRLKRLLLSLTSNEWELLVELFSNGFQWILAGYSKPEELYQYIPSFVLEEFSKNILICSYLDLDESFKDCFALLCHPLFWGGGSTARIAISYEIPVLCCEDKKSDIANILPPSNLFQSFAEQLLTLKQWIGEPTKKTEFVDLQRKMFESKSDIVNHKSFLPEAVLYAIRKFKERRLN